ncbi:MAG: LAGLIDADG family homing endonuclease [Candidatus Nanoarchaeia archaeon]
MKITSELAEIAGMFAADGCLQKGYLCMWGNIYQDKNYYNNIVGPLFSKVFKIKFNIHEKVSNSVYGFYICNRKIVKFFNKELGFPIGSKTYIVKTPKNILKSKKANLYSSFIRGFVDCDGCLNFDKKRGEYVSLFNKTYHMYPRIIIKCASLNIIEDIQFMLNYLNINNKIYLAKSNKKNEVNQYKIILYGSKAIKFIQKIGFKNEVNISKYKIYSRFGFCPSKTTLKERRKILKGEISPYSYYGTVAQAG